MASSRVIRKGLRSSDVIGQLSFKEIWLYEGLLFEADDYGLFEARSKSLRRDITGEKENEFTVEEVESFLQRASDLGLIILYEVEGRRYGWVQKFRQQVRAKRSLFPPPPGYVIHDKKLIAVDKHIHSTCLSDDNHEIGKNGENCSISKLGKIPSTCTANDNHLLANVHLDEDEVKDEYEVKEKERDEDEASPDGSLAAPSRSSLPLPSSPEEVEAYLKNEVARCRLKLLPRDASDCALQYWADRGGSGWVDKFSCPIADWKANALGYALRWARNLDAKGQLPGEESDPFDPRFRKNI